MKPKLPSQKSHPLIEWLPQEEGKQRVLRERAQIIAHEAVMMAKKTSETSYICFRLGPQEKYGLPYEYVKEVMPHLNTTHLPRAPEFIAGVINRRGALLAVLDLKRLFRIQSTEYQNASILIASTKNMTLGILVDSIVGSYSYELSALDAPLPSEGLIKPAYILGLHQAQTALLNMDAILMDVQSQLQGTL